MRPGQALVIILLMMAVALTVGLAIVSRSVTDVGVSTTSAQSARALAAAEAGIEAALGGQVTVNQQVAVESNPTSSTGTYTVVSSTAVGGGDSVSFTEGVKAGDAATLFFLAHDDAGNLDLNSSGANRYDGTSVIICWVIGSGDPALEAVLYYIQGANYVATRNIYDPEGIIRTPGSHSPDATASNCPTGTTYLYQKNINLTETIANGGLAMPTSGITPLFLRLKLLYSGDTNHQLAAMQVGGDQFPAQARQVETIGQVGSNTRRVQVTERYPDLPPYFDNALLSGSDLKKD